jgi:hypothetical protein
MGRNNLNDAHIFTMKKVSCYDFWLILSLYHVTRKTRVNQEGLP